MRTLKPTSRRRPVWQWVLLALLVLVVGGAVTVAGLVGLRIVDPAHLAFWRQQTKEYPADWVAVPISAQKIPAYSAITKEQLTNPKTGQLATMIVPPDAVPKKAIVNLSMIGRVVGREHHPGFAFTEDELLPPGSHAGVAGGTPVGKRSLTLDAGKLKGVFGLQEGDHLDLLADIPVDRLSAFGGADAGRPVYLTALAATEEKGAKKPAETRVLARDAVIVSPVTTRARPVTSSSMMGGTSTRTVPVQEVVLAVAEDDVGRVTKALDWDLEILCATRSGRPEPKEAAPAAPSAVAVPVLVREVPAYSELTEADFLDPVTQRTRYESASLAEVNRRGIVPNVADLIGRVVRRQLFIGRVIIEDDLLPRGARPGITGGLEHDRQAMSIEADKIIGVENLRAGDRLDVVAGFSLEQKLVTKDTEKLSDGTVRTIEGQRSTIRPTRLSSEASLGGRAEHWYVAIDAELVVPLGTVVNRAAAAPANDKSKPQVVVAVESRDVPSMAQALAAKEIVLTAVARPAEKPGGPGGKPAAPEGMVVVPAAPKGLPAFEPLTRESLRNQETRREEWRLLDARTAADEHVLTDPQKLLGRILNKEKRQGEYFVEGDFLPPWVKPGLAARVPPGKCAVVIPLAKRELQQKSEPSQSSDANHKTNGEPQLVEVQEQTVDGSHIDILAARPLQFGSNVVVVSGGSTLANRMRVTPVVHDGILLHQTSLDVVLAVDPAEVAPLEEALAGHAVLRMVLHSGQVPDPSKEPSVAGFDGSGGASTIEALVGSKREIYVFGGANQPAVKQ
jgi:hypothetical protein